MTTNLNNLRGKRKSKPKRNNESGYALVAVLAMMSILALAMIAAAPQLQKRQQREMELEAIARGEQLADAIGTYIQCRRVPPSSLEELQKEGCPSQGSLTKRRYLVRASSLKDPLARPGADDDDTKWRLIGPQSREMIAFSRAIANFADGQTPTHNLYPQMQQFAPATALTVRGLDSQKDLDGSDGGSKDADKDGDKDTGLDSDGDAQGDYKGPFIGVVSRSRNASIIAYYGIERHNRWIFTPAYR